MSAHVSVRITPAANKPPNTTQHDRGLFLACGTKEDVLSVGPLPHVVLERPRPTAVLSPSWPDNPGVSTSVSWKGDERGRASTRGKFGARPWSETHHFSLCPGYSFIMSPHLTAREAVTCRPRFLKKRKHILVNTQQRLPRCLGHMWPWLGVVAKFCRGLMLNSTSCSLWFDGGVFPRMCWQSWSK